MSWWAKNHTTLLLLCITIVGAVLRLAYYPELEFSHDEFSALHRTGYESFGALIEKGVQTDAHPAFAQVLMHYTTVLFGANPSVVKLPFVVMGIACIPLIFFLVNLWGSTSAALLAAATIATLQYPILYSTLARPYGSGLFLSILTLIFWTLLVRKSKITFDFASVGFVLAAALSAHNHHFGLLWVGLLGLAGLWWVAPENRWRFVAVGGFVMLLYLPYLPIFWVQLQKGGVEGWLAKPNNDFLMQYLRYLWHFSAGPLLLVGGFFVMGSYTLWHQKAGKRKILLWLGLFLLPFLIGFAYSKYISAVLQYSVLIFSFPALLLLIFGGIKQWGASQNILAVLGLMGLNFFTLVVNRQHFDVYPKSFYAEAFKTATQVTDPANTGFLMDMPIKIARHYQTKSNTNFDTIPKDIPDYLTWLHRNHLNKTQLFLALDANADPRKLAWALAFYPEVAAHQTYFTGDVYLLQKGTPSKPLVAHHNTTSSQAEFLPGITWQMAAQPHHRNDFFDVWLACTDCPIEKDWTLVVEIISDEKVWHWQGYPLDAHVVRPSQNRWVNTLKMADLPAVPRDAVIRAYLWNPEKTTVPPHSLRLNHRGGNPILYGWYHEIE